MSLILGKDELRRIIRGAVRRLPAADRFTRLNAECIFHRERHGIDALLTSGALVREALRCGNGDARLLADDSKTRADAVFETLFTGRSPASDAAQAVLLSLRKLGLSDNAKSLTALRSAYARVPLESRVIDALDMANLSSVAVRVDLFDEETVPLNRFDDRIVASLRVDALANPQTAWMRLAESGCRSLQDVRALIRRQAEKHEAESLTAERAGAGPLFEECVLQAAEALRLPVLYAENVKEGVPDANELRAHIAEAGFSFPPFCSGARVLEQLPGLWAQARYSLIDALTPVYTSLLRTGWQLSAGEIAHDIELFIGTKSNKAKKRDIEFTDRMDIVHKQEV